MSVQVNIVAVSVFHRFPFDRLIQVSANQLSLFLCVPSVFMANDRTCEDAMHTSLPGSPTPLSSNFGSPVNEEAAEKMRYVMDGPHGVSSVPSWTSMKHST